MKHRTAQTSWLWFQSFGLLVHKAGGPTVHAGMTGKLRPWQGWQVAAVWTEGLTWDCIISLPQLLLASSMLSKGPELVVPRGE